MSTVRIPWFDNIKGLMIWFVVFGHLISTFKEIEGNEFVLYLYNTIYFFHMPVFIMISGYFYRPNRQERVIRFLFIFLIWHFINGVMINIFEEQKPLMIGPESRMFEVFDPYWTMWYLLGIVLWYMITPYVLLLRYPLLYAIGFAVLFSYTEDVTGWFSLRKLVNFYPYFLFGYFLAKKNILIRLKEKMKKQPLVIRAPALFVLISFLIAMIYFTKQFPKGSDFLLLDESYQFFHWRFLKGLMYHLLLYFLAAMVSISIIMLIPKNRKLYLINTFGYFSLYIYLAHTMFVRLFRLYAPDSVYQNSWLLIIVTIMLAFFICYLATNKYVRKIIKPLIEPNVQILFKKE